MDEFLKPVFSDQINPSIRGFIDNLKDDTDQLFKNKLGISYGPSYVPLSTPDWKRVLASIDVKGDRVALCIKNAVIQCSTQAECIAAFGGLIATLAFVHHQINLNEPCREGDDISFLKKSARISEKEYFALLQNIIKDKCASSITIDAIELAGFSGQIFIVDDSNHTTYLELRNGHNFSISSLPEFRQILNTKDWTANNVAAIIIDGTVETIGEIHHILEYCSVTKRPVVIFARGYSEEVVATIITNNLRGTLNLVPVRVPLDISSLNMLKDLAVVCGVDVVSSLKGELISSINLDSLPSIDSIRITDKSICILNENTKLATVRHTKELIKKRAEQSSEDIEKLIDDRLQQMSSNSVVINLGPELLARRGSIADKIGTGLQLLKDVSNFGVISTQIMTTSNNLTVRKLGNLLSSYGYNHFSSRAVHAGITLGIKTSELLMRAPVFLVQQN
nr:hypothetical protein [Rhodospirillales bacterium]